MNPQHLYEVTQDIETWRLNPTPDNVIMIHTGSITSPTKKSSTDNEAKKWLEIVRRDSFLWKKKP